MELDNVRREILATPGHLLVSGGPGCGKTTIALLKAQAFTAQLQPEQRVLFLSFSRAAVRQISDRMRGTITAATRAHLEVRTFHAFFMEIVRCHGGLLHGHPVSFIPPDRAARLKADFVGDWEAETGRLADEEGKYVFDRIAGAAAALLQAVPMLRDLYSDAYPLIIVDEFQDTDDDQWNAVRAMSDQTTLLCLADPDQRIYDWVPGVDAARIDNAVAVLRPRLFDLSKDNHRSSGSGLLDYANAVLRNDPHATTPAAVKTLIYRNALTLEVATHWVTARLEYELSTSLGRPATIGVLAPTNGLIARISTALSTETPLGGQVLPALPHELHWDAVLTASAAYVIASVLEWPQVTRDAGIAATLQLIADFYLTKIGSGTAGARATVNRIQKGLREFQASKRIVATAPRAIVAAFDRGLDYIGEPVPDWQTARAFLQGVTDLDTIFTTSRLVRLFQATDGLAWALADSWNGVNGYTDAAASVRRVLAADLIESGRTEVAHGISLMSMHKSKGKEFDGVVIVESRFGNDRLLDSTWSAKEVQDRRRLLRVAITRARSEVAIVRPYDGLPLTGFGSPNGHGL